MYRQTICSTEDCGRPRRKREWCERCYTLKRRHGELEPLKNGFETFWDHINKEGPIVRPELGPCWVWTLRTLSNGYGYFQVNNKQISTHCYAWEYANKRSIPNGLLVRHRCDNRPCCRPDHLLVGTHQDNIQDAIERNRFARGERVAMARLTEANVLAIRAAYALGNIKITELAKQYGVERHTISHVIHRQTWKHVA